VLTDLAPSGPILDPLVQRPPGLDLDVGLTVHPFVRFTFQAEGLSEGLLPLRVCFGFWTCNSATDLLALRATTTRRCLLSSALFSLPPGLGPPGPPGLVKASLEDGGASHREVSADSSCSGNFVKRVAVPSSWLEELGAEVGSFVPPGSACLLACLPRHRQVSSYRGVPFENKQGR